MSKPAIVFIHGSWHNPSMYSPTLSRLTDAGYNVLAPSLPTVGKEDVAMDFWEDVEAVRKAVIQAIDGGQDVIMVAHSYGGNVCTQAPEGLLKKDREARGLKNGVIHVYYIAAYAMDEGESSRAASSWPGFAGVAWVDFKENGQIFPHKDLGIDALYNDLPRKEAEALFAQLKVHSAHAGATQLTYAAWKHVPCTYLICTIDKAIAPEIQERMASRLTSHLGKDCTIERIEAGHTPTNSRPEEVTLSIRRAAGEAL